jgi:hypothetical protein
MQVAAGVTHALRRPTSHSLFAQGLTAPKLQVGLQVSPRASYHTGTSPPPEQFCVDWKSLIRLKEPLAFISSGLAAELVVLLLTVLPAPLLVTALPAEPLL